MIKLLVYLKPSLKITSIHPDILRLLLQQERSADDWSSLLRRISSLSKEESFSLVNTMTSVRGEPKDNMTLFKKSHTFFTSNSRFVDRTGFDPG